MSTFNLAFVYLYFERQYLNCLSGSVTIVVLLLKLLLQHYEYILVYGTLFVEIM